MLYVTRRERFSAAHKLWNTSLSDNENNKIFGKCAYPNSHGHNYQLFVTVKGEVNSKTGYVIDAKKLSSIIKKNIIDKTDHRNLNLDVDFLENTNPTIENLLLKFWEQIETPVKLEGCNLHKIKLVETENNYGEYYG